MDGYASRKFWYCMITSGLIFISGLLAGQWAAFGVNLTTIIGGLLSSLGIYCGINVAEKHVLAKNGIIGPPEVLDPMEDHPVEQEPEN